VNKSRLEKSKSLPKKIKIKKIGCKEKMGKTAECPMGDF